MIVAAQGDGYSFDRVCNFLRRLGARPDEEQPGMNLAGAITDQFWMAFTIQDGERVEVSYDGFLGTSLSGDAAVIAPLADAYAKDSLNG